MLGNMRLRATSFLEAGLAKYSRREYFRHPPRRNSEEELIPPHGLGREVDSHRFVHNYPLECNPRAKPWK